MTLKNTAISIAAAIADLVGVTASKSGLGATALTEAVAKKSLANGAAPVINATAAHVVTAVDALAEFSAVETVAGNMDVVAETAFTGGVDEVKPLKDDTYSILEGTVQVGGITVDLFNSYNGWHRPNCPGNYE